MIEEPGTIYFAEFKTSGADMLTVHAEACKHLDSTFRHIREAGMKAGVAINPGTPLCVVEDVLESVRYGTDYDGQSRIWRAELY